MFRSFASPGNTTYRGGSAHGVIHRYYDPHTGRYLQPDPLSVTLPGFDQPTYSYALNNPLRYIDPTGQSAETIARCYSECVMQTLFASDEQIIGAGAATAAGLVGVSEGAQTLAGNAALDLFGLPGLEAAGSVFRIGAGVGKGGAILGATTVLACFAYCSEDPLRHECP